MQLGFVANGFEVLATTIPCLILIMLHSAIVQAIPRSHEQRHHGFSKNIHVNSWSVDPLFGKYLHAST